MLTPPLLRLAALFAVPVCLTLQGAAVARAEGLDAAAIGQVQEMATQAAALGLGQAGALLPRRPGSAAPRIEVVPGSLDPRLRLAPCERVEAYLPAGARAWGRTRVGLRCTQGAGRWNVSLPLTVRVWAPAVVLAAPLPAGSTLAAEHLGLAEVDWAADTAGAFADPAALLGRTLARPLAAGNAVRQNDLRARQWFAAGDTVRLVANGPGFALSTDATALSPGVEGLPARVRTEGGRVVVGRPVGERRLEVLL